MVKISNVRVRPLVLPLKQPYHWSYGIRESFAVNLIEIEADDGTVGIGECTVAPDQTGTAAILYRLAKHLVGHSPHDVAPLIARIFHQEYLGHGANIMRAANQIFSGIDMAMWDLQGKLAGLPVHQLLGGAHRKAVGYFYFLQGETAEELARGAAVGHAQGERVFYLKVGRGEKLDLEITAAVRGEIGDARLRLDANEGWSVHDAINMCRKLEKYDIEFIEQPTVSWSIPAMAHVREKVGIPIVADQAAFTLYDVYEICRQRAADMICIGPREIGGIQPMMKAAAVAEAAGLKICIHSSFTTGITTCAEHHIGLAIPNLDDGNQIMWQLVQEDIVSSPDLTPKNGWLDAFRKPGLGFQLAEDLVAEGEGRYAASR
ncbi:mandelate racemase/muconate lactonizing enzyme family protein [Sinorhizobium meliloti]|uniref:mandelate racemase/muconate lactonizing enzyme family protein n=1 Tax=Rhizobium meliloti TaxID=382 RepID=UPI00237F65F0|nr:mandelate racemase/muconate lactonizing enzyme family protein [Sinorhizobium meliloti]MDE3812961.1 mandelate racemase/muconate lactonizing enzyme family protein [Sinorhizobium meliloti]